MSWWISDLLVFNKLLISANLGKAQNLMTSDKTEFAEMFRKRTKKFVVDNINFFKTLPKTEEAKIIGRQLLRSSSSVGANIRQHAEPDLRQSFIPNFL